LNFLRIKKLNLSNIRCFKEVEIAFIKGNNILVGENGSGKSTILNSIGIGLFGTKYIYQMPFTIEQMITHNSEQGIIQLEFETHEGEFLSEFTIIKDRPNKWTLKKMTNNEWSQIASMITEVQAQIFQILGGFLDEVSFKNALCSPQGQISNLLEVTSSERRNMIYRILGAEKYDKVAIHVDRLIKDLNNKLDLLFKDQKVYNEKIQFKPEIEVKIKELEKKLIDLQSTLTKVSKEYNKKQSKLEEKEGILNEQYKQIAKEENLVKIVKSYSKEIEKLEEEISNFQTQANLKGSTLDELETRVNQLKTKIDEESKQEKLISVQISNFKRNEMEIKDKTKEISDIKSNILKLEENKSEIFKSDEEYNTILEKIEKIDNKIREIEKSKELLNQKQENYKNQKNSITKQIKSVESRINKLKSDFKGLFDKDIENINDLYKSTNDVIEKLEGEITELEKQVDNAKSMISEYKAKQKEIQQVLELLNLKTKDDSRCPTCHQSLKNINYEELTKSHEKQLEKLTTEKDELSTELKITQKKLDYTSNNYKTIIQLSHKLESFTNRIEELKQDENTRDDLITQISEINEEMKKIERSLLEISKNNIEKLKEKLNEYTNKHKKYIELENKINNEQEKLKIFTKIIDQATDQNKNVDINILKSTLSDLESSVLSNQNLQKLLIGNLIPAFRNKIEKQIKLTEANNELIEVQNKLMQLPKVSIDEVSLLKKSRDDLLTQKGTITQEITSIKNEKLLEFKEQLKEIFEFEKELTNLKKSIEDLSIVIDKLNIAHKMLALIPVRLLEKVATSVSNKMTERVQSMLPNKGFNQIMLKTTGEVNISRRGVLVPISLLSGGEKTVLALSLRMALAMHVAPLNFMILDEPTTYLDQERIEDFMEIVHRDKLFRDQNGQLLLVTHRDEFMKTASRVIKIDVSPAGRRKLRIDNE
jgi:DNA repair protein SbcC/Rad50